MAPSFLVLHHEIQRLCLVVDVFYFWGTHWTLSSDKDVFTQLPHYITPVFHASCFKFKLERLVLVFHYSGQVKLKQHDWVQLCVLLASLCICVVFEPAHLHNVYLKCSITCLLLSLFTTAQSFCFPDVVADINISVFMTRRTRACLASRELKT